MQALVLLRKDILWTILFIGFTSYAQSLHHTIFRTAVNTTNACRTFFKNDLYATHGTASLFCNNFSDGNVWRSRIVWGWLEYNYDRHKDCLLKLLGDNDALSLWFSSAASLGNNPQWLQTDHRLCGEPVTCQPGESVDGTGDGNEAAFQLIHYCDLTNRFQR